MIIIGAGMAGLLAARMLAHRKPVVWEAQAGLPNNHAAVLRFRTSQIGDLLGIPFKKVNMIKDVVPWQNPIADSLAYSWKNTGEFRSDRSVVRGLVSEERFIAPPDFISQMSEGVKIEFERKFTPLNLPYDGAQRAEPIISTIPMPILMEVLNYDGPSFDYRGGATITTLIEACDAYVSLLVPRPSSMYSRVSITGNQMIVEVPFQGQDDTTEDVRSWAKQLDAREIALDAANLLGIPANAVIAIGDAKPSQYQKIVPVSDDIRRDFMFNATATHGIYSLGRFATWRPGLLLDDLVQDIRLIDRWIGRSNYDLAKRR
jgi:hypothetical protein